MISKKEVVEHLRALIKDAEFKIEEIYDDCDHHMVEHEMYPDYYCGQGQSSSCVLCGKFLNCSTGPASLIETKKWIEDKSNG